MSIGKTNLHRIILLFAVIINLLVAINAVFHNPFVGYDADGHLDYISILAVRLPTKSDSAEYFSPPLPYFLPSLIFQVCTSDTITCKNIAGKFAQGINLLLSIGITIFILRIAEFLRPDNQYFKMAVLIVFGLFTVYYKTFSQVRGEPYLAFFETLSIYFVLKLSQTPQTNMLRDGMLLGISLGALGLSRQWGFLLFPAIGCIVPLIVIKDKDFGLKYGRILLFSFFIAFITCSWFYFHLYKAYGSFTAFNIRPKAFSFTNQPLSFYRNTGIGNLLLFRSPTRKTFNNQFIPIFYSDTWGDYWGYFTFRREGVLWRYHSNQSEMNPYLGRVNFVSLFPSLILAGGMIFGCRSLLQSLRFQNSSFASRAFAFLFLIVLTSLGGYLWFLIKYPLLPQGVTIKATYLIQIFIVLPFLAADFLENIRAGKPQFYRICLLLFLFVFAHNLPAMITRYW